MTSDTEIPTYATPYLRLMLRKRLRERDFRGAWFYGYWIALRWNVFPIAVGLVCVVAGFAIGTGL